MVDMSESEPTGYGAVLRSRREKLGLSLDDLAASTRVRKTYLQALEEENHQLLPGNAYVIGFLRIYARQVGLPVEPLLRSFEAVDTGDEGAAEPSAGAGHQRRPRKAARKGRGIGWLLLVVVCLAALAVAVFFWQRRGDAPAPPEPEAKSPSSVQVEPMPQPQAQPLPAPPPVAPQSRNEAPPGQSAPEVVFVEFPVLPDEGAIVRLVPVSAGVLRVSLDSQELREYPLQPDQPLNWKVTRSLAVELSAPGLVRVWVEQAELPVAELSAFVLKSRPRTDARP